jgi:hypothetical protein
VIEHARDTHDLLAPSDRPPPPPPALTPTIFAAAAADVAPPPPPRPTGRPPAPQKTPTQQAAAPAETAAAAAAAATAQQQHTRAYFAPIAVEFTEGVRAPAAKPAAAEPLTATLARQRAETEEALKLLQTYKELGDAADEPYLKYHNPRTFEDLSKPVPNFRTLGLKAGEVPAFFDGVLSARAAEAVRDKALWWDERRAAALAAAKERKFAPLGTVPVPEWRYGSGVSMDALKKATDAYLAALVPERQLRVPAAVTSGADAAALAKAAGPGVASAVSAAVKGVVYEGGKPVHGLAFLSAAEARARLTGRRAEVHGRFLRMWARRLLATPEQALVPLRERDALLASKFEDVSPKYNALLDLVARGPEAYGARLAGCEATDSFLLRRSKQAIADMFPPSAQETEAAALASQLEDRAAALERLLGPALEPEGSPSRLKSEEARAMADQLYAPGRLMHAEGLRLAARYAEEEAALAARLRAEGGAGDRAEVLAAQREALTPAQRAARHAASDAKRAAAALEAERLEAQREGHAYAEYALARRAAFESDPANLRHPEILFPRVAAERFAIEMAELDAADAALDEAEEEELWLLTLAAQSAHAARHLEFDLPQAAVAHMDPILYKKLDWETTHGLDLLHREADQAADCEQGEYVRAQYGLENLSHHFLPLIRYRRQKWRRLHGSWPPELSKAPAQ